MNIQPHSLTEDGIEVAHYINKQFEKQFRQLVSLLMVMVISYHSFIGGKLARASQYYADLRFLNTREWIAKQESS